MGVSDTAAPDPPIFEPAPVEWEEFNDAVDVGTVEVPVDYADPEGARFELYLARYNALDPDNRIGTLLYNPGGPGVPGTEYAIFAAQLFDSKLLERIYERLDGSPAGSLVARYDGGLDPSAPAESSPPTVVTFENNWHGYTVTIRTLSYTPITDEIPSIAIGAVCVLPWDTSIVLIVLREPPIAAASSLCVRRLSARSTRMRL